MGLTAILQLSTPESPQCLKLSTSTLVPAVKELFPLTEHPLRRQSPEDVRTGLVEERHPRQVVRRHHRPRLPLLRFHPLEGPVLEATQRAHPRLLARVHEAPVDPARHAVQLQGIG